MDSNISNSSSILSTGVSRRGGVRVRGGRLPPIRIRDAVLTPTSTKKTFEPKIPQRRIKVKEEEAQKSTEKCQTSDNKKFYESADSRHKSSRGRGRGAKVFVQSEGTFLGEGPAFKTKKEAQTSSYERGPSKGSKSKESGSKFDANSLKYLFDNSEGDELYDGNLILPVKFPIVKQDLKEEIKQEIKEEVKIKIKQEIVDEDIKDEFKIVIKQEPIDPSEAEESVVSTLLEKIDSPEKGNIGELDDELKFITGEGNLILFQLPSFLPFKKVQKNSDQSTSASKSSKDSKTNDETQTVDPEIDLKSLGEGRIGKLQVFKSGKMRLVTGSMTMSVERSSEIPTISEVASVSVGNDREEGDIIVLGRVDHKLIVRPSFEEDIVKQMANAVIG